MSEPPAYNCALITGASAGLGEEFALQLASQCRRLVLVSRREEALKRLETRLRIDHPGLEVASVPCDLAEDAARRELIDQVAGTEWTPGLLVNNAGVGDHGEFATADWEKVSQMMEVNMTALTHLAHGFLPDMIRNGKGAILNVSSLSSLLPIPDFAVYAATKSYVSNFSEALRLELRDYDIPVLALCPGPVHTQFGETAGRAGESPDLPTRQWFYVDKADVVREGLLAIRQRRARSYPGWKVALLAAGISLLPLAAVRYLMSHRPRSISEVAES